MKPRDQIGDPGWGMDCDHWDHRARNNPQPQVDEPGEQTPSLYLPDGTKLTLDPRRPPGFTARWERP